MRDDTECKAFPLLRGYKGGEHCPFRWFALFAMMQLANNLACIIQFCVQYMINGTIEDTTDGKGGRSTQGSTPPG